MNAMFSSEKPNEKNLEMEYDLYCNELTDIINRIFECIRFFRSHVPINDLFHHVAIVQRFGELPPKVDDIA